MPSVNVSSTAVVPPRPRWVRSLDRPRGDRPPDRSVGGAVEGGGADHRAQQRDRSGHRARAGQTRQRRAQPDGAIVVLERRESREQVEGDAERVAALAPAFDPEERHPDELNEGVGHCEHGQRGRMLPVDEHQLEPGETDDPGDGGPAPEPSRVGQRSPAERGRQTGAPRSPGRGTGERPPRVERAEHIPEEGAEDRHAHPEEHVDGGRRQVGGRDLAAADAADHHDHERGHAEQAEHGLEHRRVSEQAARARPLEPRRGPQGGQSDEREHEHDAGRPREQPRRHGQIGPADEPVRRGRARPRSHAAQRGDDRAAGSGRRDGRVFTCDRRSTPSALLTADVTAVVIRSSSSGPARERRRRSF